MRADQFKQFVATAVADEVVFYHSGFLDQETVTGIGAVLRRRLQEEGASGAQARKVFTTFMEMAQNIVHYAASEQADPVRFGALSVVRHGAGFAVMCGNYLDGQQVPRVRGRLQEVQEMSPDSVRQAYRRQLAADGEDQHSKGAGLGLLTMAASATAPIEFAFDPDSPDPAERTFLFLKAII